MTKLMLPYVGGVGPVFHVWQQHKNASSAAHTSSHRSG